MQVSEAVHLNQGTAYAEEMRKWEATHTKYGPPGRPFVHRDYPMMLYKATRPSTGGSPSFDHIEVADEQERERQEARGYHAGGPAGALHALEKQEFEIAELAANRAFNDRKMTPKAQEEAAQAERETIKHLAEIPALPIKKRGRPKKVQTV